MRRDTATSCATQLAMLDPYPERTYSYATTYPRTCGAMARAARHLDHELANQVLAQPGQPCAAPPRVAVGEGLPQRGLEHIGVAGCMHGVAGCTPRVAGCMQSYCSAACFSSNMSIRGGGAIVRLAW